MIVGSNSVSWPLSEPHFEVRAKTLSKTWISREIGISECDFLILKK